MKRSQPAPGSEAVHKVDVLGQAPHGVAATTVRTVAERTLGVLGQAPTALSIRFASDATLRRFNRRYRGISRATDILSFPLGEPLGPHHYLGDILISRDRARAQAARGGLSLRREVQELVLHGVLHLLGYDHEADDGEMDRLERSLRGRILDRKPGNRREGT